MSDAICENTPINTSICHSAIEDKPKVAVLEDSDTVRTAIKEIIENVLGWEIIFVENQEQAVKLYDEKEIIFYILDIDLGKNRRKEGLHTAEVIKGIQEKTFVSIFSGYPDRKFKKMAMKIGVDLFEQKGVVLKEGACKIALEMLDYQKQIVNDLLQDYLTKIINDFFKSEIKLEIKPQINQLYQKIKDINQKIEDIHKLEISYLQNNRYDEDKEKSCEPYICKEIKEDKNINAYKKLKENEDWVQKYQGKYIAFADGELLENFISKNSDDLLANLRKDKKYKNKSVFYIQVQKQDIIMDLPMSLLF